MPDHPWALMQLRQAPRLRKSISGFLSGRKGLTSPSSSGGQADESLCPKAIEAARKGVKMSAAAKQEKKGETEPTKAPVQRGQELGKDIRNLFGK